MPTGIRITAGTLALCAATTAIAAPYELSVYGDDLSAPGETEFETVFSLARPSTASHLSGRVGQALAEANYGIAKGWEIGLELPAVYSSQRHRVEGLAVEVQYIYPHDKNSGAYWGIRGDVEHVASIYEDDTATSLDLNPVIGYRGASYNVVVNPSLERTLSGNETTTRFEPSAKLAMRASARDEIGLEYYGDCGNVQKLLPPSKRDESLYLVWDRRTWFGRLNMGFGQGLRPTSGSSDKWIAKIGIQFDTD